MTKHYITIRYSCTESEGITEKAISVDDVLWQRNPEKVGWLVRSLPDRLMLELSTSGKFKGE
jgi:hypothetical protein